MKKILILGGTTFDHIVYVTHLPNPTPQTIHQVGFNETTGSTGAGKSLNFTKLGVPNTLYSVLGDDAYGSQIITHLKKEGVDLVYDIDKAGTERHFNIMDKNGGRISMFITQSTQDVEINMARVEDLIKNNDLIVLNIISYCKQLIPVLRKYEKPVWTDLHDYDGRNIYHNPFIEAAQYIHLSSDNLPDYEPIMHQLIDSGKKLVICTHGKQGSTLLSADGEWIEQPALPIDSIVDANGAGDSFFAGFLFGFMNNQPLARCMKMGAVCASLCITSKQLASEKLSAAYLQSAI